MDKKIIQIIIELEEINFLHENLSCLVEAGIVGNILGIIASPTIWFLWRSSHGIFSQAARRCGIYKISNQRDECLINANIDLLKKRINILNRLKSDNKDRSKYEKIDEKIRDYQQRLNEYNEKLRLKKENNYV